MFYFVLLTIALTNVAVGYAVAAHFGYTPGQATGVDVAAQGVTVQPRFTIVGGVGEETPLDELPAAEPMEVAVEPVVANESVGDSSQDKDLSADDEIPAEVRDFTALSGIAATGNVDGAASDE